MQGLLRRDEALVLFLDTPEWKPSPGETFIWVVTRTSSRWVRTSLGTAALTERVQALRCGLDFAAWLGDGAFRCAGLLKIGLDQALDSGATLPFDLAGAHDLYKSLFGGIGDLVRGKHLLIVPSGSLTHLSERLDLTVTGGDNGGLVIAEIELRHEDEIFERPPWLNIEITGQAQYYNGSLARHPFRHWATAQPATAAG